MNSKHSAAALEALYLISATQKGLAAILSHPEMKGALQKVNANLTKSATALQQLTGVFITNPGNDEIREISDGFKPLVSIGGQKLDLSRALPVKPEDLDVSEDEKLIFLARRDKLYERFTDMTVDEINASMREPDGTAIVRSVAKKAGIRTYRDADLTDAYLESVQDAIRAQQDLESTIRTADGERGIEQEEDDDDADSHQGAEEH